MSKDRSLEEIDIVKLLLFSLFFIFICMTIIFGFIVPDIKELKEIKTKYSAEKIKFLRINGNYETSTLEINDLQKNNDFILKAFAKNFNEEKFKSFANSFFKDIKLSKISTEGGNKRFYIYELNVSSSLDSPKDLYAFLIALNKYENIIRVNFPVHLKANERIINTKFKLAIYEEAINN